jgi:hypothetical protein
LVHEALPGFWPFTLAAGRVMRTFSHSPPWLYDLILGSN